MKKVKSIVRSRLEQIVTSRRGLNVVFRHFAAKGIRFHSNTGDTSFIYDPSEFIGRQIYETGAFQRSEIENVAKIASNEDSDRSVMLEIGANIGTTTVYAAKTGLFDKIIAIEADPKNFDLLVANIRVNGLTDTVIPICCGASDKSGSMMLQRNTLHSGMSSIEPVEGVFHTDATGSSEEIPVRKADDILAELGISPEDIALIWMDVEGHEPKALAGMEKILSTTPPLYFEFTPARYSENEVLWIEKEILGQYNSTRVYSNEWRDLPEEGVRKLDMDSHMNLFCTTARN